MIEESHRSPQDAAAEKPRAGRGDEAGIVSRLRDKRRLRKMHGLTGWVLAQEDMQTEAADEITRLRAEVTEARRLAGKLSRWITQRGRGAPDHACLRCTPWENSIVENFSCAYHDALDIESQVHPCSAMRDMPPLIGFETCCELGMKEGAKICSRCLADLKLMEEDPDEGDQ